MEEFERAVDKKEFLEYVWERFETGNLITVCSWCDRVRIEDEWVALPGGALQTIDARLTLSHSICPTCADAQPVPPGSKG